MRVAFRVDSSNLIGAGHVTRCMTMATALRSYGWDVLFICRELVGNIIYKLTENSFKVIRLTLPENVVVGGTNAYDSWLAVSVERDAEETSQVIDKFQPDWVVVDHYRLDAQWEKKIRELCSFVMVIDDLANREHDCDILLDQNYFAENSQDRYQSLVPKHCRLLLGPQYALLGPEYPLFRRGMPQRTSEIRRILIYFGNSDLGNKTLLTLHALDVPELSVIAVDIVVGSGSSDLAKIKEFIVKRPNFTLYTDMSSLAALMIRADLMIGAGGATTWERLCLQLPAIVVPLAKNQEEFTKILTKQGLQFSFEDCPQTWSLRCREKITELISRPDLVRMCIHKMCIVDGYGVKRVTQMLSSGNIEKIVMRRARSSDVGVMFFWVNDKTARDQSFNTEFITFEQHMTWFTEKMNTRDCLMFIGEVYQGLPLGQVRFDYNDGTRDVTVSIFVDPCFRGLGVAKKLLSLAMEQFQQTSEFGSRLIAEIKTNNIASQKLFCSLGFRQIHPLREHANAFEYPLVSSLDRLKK